jgi:hypothetical protein
MGFETNSQSFVLNLLHHPYKVVEVLVIVEEILLLVRLDLELGLGHLLVVHTRNRIENKIPNRSFILCSYHL